MKLDKVFLRTCAVYRLLRQRKISKDRAADLLLERHRPAGTGKIILGTLELWLSGPLSEKGRREKVAFQA